MQLLLLLLVVECAFTEVLNLNTTLIVFECNTTFIMN